MRIDWHNRIKSHIGIEYLKNITLYAVYYRLCSGRPDLHRWVHVA